MERLATTPFGGGRFTAADFQAQVWVENERGRMVRNRENGAGSNDTRRADKWQLLRALTEAKVEFGLGERTIRVLEALLSFHGEREIDGAKPIVVFPSNRELSMRTRGMAPVTIRRHIRALVAAALLIRRDSPNGKRYRVRDEDGGTEEAFGFDLSPLAFHAAAIHQAAERARAHVAAVRKVRTEITIHLRDVSRVIAAAVEEERVGDWDAFAERLAGLSGRVGRFTSLADHEARHAALVELRRDVEDAYLNAMSECELTANAVQNDRHIQNSNSEPISESNGSREQREAGRQSRDDRPSDEAEAPKVGDGEPADRRRVPISLGTFKHACPEFVSFAPVGLSTWGAVVRHAETMRPMLGISPDAMRRADDAMGPIGAAITVAAILQRQQHIRSAGGYLRALTKRAEDGRFSVRPMIDALVPKP